MPREKLFQKKEVIEDTIKLFWKNGFHKTSIQELVQTLGVNRSNLYETFKDKEHLFSECLIMYRNNVISEFNNIFSNSKTKKRGFKLFFNFLKNAYIKDLENKGCLICNSYAELLPTNNQFIRELLIDTRNTIVTVIHDELKKAKENGEIKNRINIRNEAQAIYHTMVGIAIVAKVEQDKKQLQPTSFQHHLSIFKTST